MTLLRRFHLVFSALSLTVTASIAVNAADVSLCQPIGVAADVTRVLATAPYDESACPGTTRGVYNITSGTAVLAATLPSSAHPVENYIAIAPGLGGFTAGDVFVTYANTIRKITGATSTLFSTPSGAGLDHAGISFDTVGTFGFNMIVSGENGTLYLIGPTGAVVKSIIPNPAIGGSGVKAESPRVAPLSFGPYGGWIWIAGESTGKLIAISPFTAGDGTNASVVLPANFPPLSPESVQFVGDSVCSIRVGTGPTAVNQSYFDAIFGANLVRTYDITGIKNLAIVNEEFTNNIDEVDATGNIIGSFPATVGGQQEGTSIVFPRTDTPGCPVTSHCTLTQGGYKNRFNSLLLNLPTGGLTIGTTFYNNIQLNQMLQNNAVQGNGLTSLVHQLITAQLNIYYGTIPSQAVSQAIVTANQLIGALVPAPLGAGFLAPATTSGVESVLDAFNNSSECR